MKELKQGFMIFVLLSILTGLIYPTFITIVAQILWRENANGSLIRVDKNVIGCRLIGQKFTNPKYFHGRPSAVDYKGSVSGASNLGPTSKKLIENVIKEINRVRIENNLPINSEIPADLALSSASGLDPHISLDSALLQARRVSRVRGLSLDKVNKLIYTNLEKPQFKFLGKTRVNVLVLNLALDENKI